MHWLKPLGMQVLPPAMNINCAFDSFMCGPIYLQRSFLMKGGCLRTTLGAYFMIASEYHPYPIAYAHHFGQLTQERNNNHLASLRKCHNYYYHLP